MAARGRRSLLLAGFLVAVFLVCLPTGTTGASVEDRTSTAVAELGGERAPSDFPDFLEVGEGARVNEDGSKAHPGDKAVRKRQRQVLKKIDKLMNLPEVNYFQAKAYLEAGPKINKIEYHIKDELMALMQMKALSNHMSVNKVKAAMHVEQLVDSWAREAGELVMEASSSKASASACKDSHPGLCAGIQVQGHCGIEEYAKACPLSCHRCKREHFVRLIGDSPDERKQKQAEERGGKKAAEQVREKFLKKEAKLRATIIKEKAQLKMAQHAASAAEEAIESTKITASKLKQAPEKVEKSAKKRALKAKAQAKVASEKLKKDKEKPKAGKVDASQVKTAKAKEKEKEEKVKARQKDLKKTRDKKKKDEKAVKDLEKKKASAIGDMDAVRKGEAEVSEKKMEVTKYIREAQKLQDKEKAKMLKWIADAAKKDQEADDVKAARSAVMKEKMKTTLAQEVKLNGAKHRNEIQSKAELKREQEMEIPGVERKVKTESLKADKDILNLKTKFKRDAIKYAHLGLKWKIPVEMAEDLAKAKKAKAKVSVMIKGLNKELRSPATQKLKSMEFATKSKMSAEDAKYRGLKKIMAGEKKQLADFLKKDKARRDAIEKELGMSTKMANKIMKDANDKQKKDEEDRKKAEKKIAETMNKASKDHVTEDAMIQAEKKLERVRAQTKREKKSIARREKSVRKAKKEILQADKNVVKAKGKIATEVAKETAKQKKRVAKEKAVVETAKVKEKSANVKVKAVKKLEKKAKDVGKKLETEEKKASQASLKVVKLSSKEEQLEGEMEALKASEPKQESGAMAAGIAQADAKFLDKKAKKATEKKEEKRAEKKAESAAEIAGLSGKAKEAAKDKAKIAVEQATSKAKKATKAKVEMAEEEAAKKAAKGGGEIGKAVKKAEKKAEKKAKEDGDDPKEAKKEAKEKVLDAVEKAKEKAEEESKEDEKEAAKEAVSKEENDVVDSATGAMLNVAKEAIAEVQPISAPDEALEDDPDDCSASATPRVDAHPSLCKKVKKQGHCNLRHYRAFCRATCNPCKVPAATKVPPRKKPEEDPVEEELADSKEDSISDLEAQLGKSIAKANAGMTHVSDGGNGNA